MKTYKSIKNITRFAYDRGQPFQGWRVSFSKKGNMICLYVSEAENNHSPAKSLSAAKVALHDIRTRVEACLTGTRKSLTVKLRRQLEKDYPKINIKVPS